MTALDFVYAFDFVETSISYFFAIIVYKKWYVFYVPY